MLKTTLGYRTISSGNVLSLDLFGQMYHRDQIPLFYPREDLGVLCHHGHHCNGLSGGCPPYAPYFDDIKPSCDWFYVVVVRMDVAWAIQYAGSGEYLRFKYVNMLTASYLHRIMSGLSQVRTMFHLGAGGCNGCGSSKNCTVLVNQPCAKPDKRVYSVEATGVDCSELYKMIYGHRLPYWYYDGALPRYMVRYGGIFLNDPGDIDLDLLMVAKADKSYIPVVPQHMAKRLVKRTAPAHVIDAGMEYLAYEMLEDGSYEEID